MDSTRLKIKTSSFISKFFIVYCILGILLGFILTNEVDFSFSWLGVIGIICIIVNKKAIETQSLTKFQHFFLTCVIFLGAFYLPDIAYSLICSLIRVIIEKNTSSGGLPSFLQYVLPYFRVLLSFVIPLIVPFWGRISDIIIVSFAVELFHSLLSLWHYKFFDMPAVIFGINIYASTIIRYFILVTISIGIGMAIHFGRLKKIKRVG